MTVDLLGLVGGVKDLEEQLTGDPNGYIGKNSRAICDAYATDPANRAFTDFPGSSRLRSTLGNICQPYYDQLGVPAPTEEVPFTGGQCPVVYSVQYFIRDTANPNDNGTTASVNVNGPIGGVAFQPDPQLPGRSIAAILGSPPVGVASLIDETIPTTTFQINSVTRLDGQPDDCGSLPPVPQPVPNYPNPRGWGEPQFVDGPGTDPYTYTPKTDPATGTPWIEIDGPEGTIGLPPLGGPKPNFDEPPAPPELGDPIGGDGGPGEEDIPDTEDEDGRICIGVKWVIGNLPSGFQRIPGTVPAVFPRVVGSIQLVVVDSMTEKLYSQNHRITSQEGSVFRDDESFKVTSVKFNFVPEVSGVELFPVYKVRSSNDR